VNGQAKRGDSVLSTASEFGWQPHAETNCSSLHIEAGATLLEFNKTDFEQLRLNAPQLNYLLRKFRINENASNADWMLDLIAIN
jgi:hypothetical protein